MSLFTRCFGRQARPSTTESSKEYLPEPQHIDIAGPVAEAEAMAIQEKPSPDIMDTQETCKDSPQPTTPTSASSLAAILTTRPIGSGVEASWGVLRVRGFLKRHSSYSLKLHEIVSACRGASGGWLTNVFPSPQDMNAEQVTECSPFELLENIRWVAMASALPESSLSSQTGGNMASPSPRYRTYLWVEPCRFFERAPIGSGSYGVVVEGAVG